MACEGEVASCQAFRSPPVSQVLTDLRIISEQPSVASEHRVSYLMAAFLSF